MKSVLIAATFFTTLFVTQSFAQRGAIGPRGGSGSRFPGTPSMPWVGPVPPLGSLGSFHHGAIGRPFGRSRFGFYPYAGSGLPYWGFDPFYDSGYAGYYADGYQPQPSPSTTIMMPQPTMPQAPPPPAPPARSEVREYKWPASNSDPSAAFSIVLKDRRLESAVAVWVQDNSVHYVAPDGRHGRLPLDSVNREETHRRNAEKHLYLWLPAGS
jgi:hypothetical protein